jgi:Acyl-CoA carboxylase epsilon subunit
MSEEPGPDIEVVKGAPTREELAALVAVVAARRAAPADDTGRPSTWAAYWRSVRAPLRHGPSGWRDSTRPR